MRFQKYPLSSRRKHGKIFSSTLWFSQRVHRSTLQRSITIQTSVLSILSSLLLHRFQIQMHLYVFERFLRPDVIVFKNLHVTYPNYGRIVFKTMHLHIVLLGKPFSKVYIFIKVFGGSSVFGRPKPKKEYAFSNENVLVWLGPEILLRGNVHANKWFSTNLLRHPKQ